MNIGLYSLGIVDNLLLIHNHSECISMVYDIKRYHLIFPIGAPSSLPLLTTKDSQISKNKQEKKKGLPSPNRAKNKTTDNINNIQTKLVFSQAILTKNLNNEGNNVAEVENESIIIGRGKNLNESIDPNYFEKMQKFHDTSENFSNKLLLKTDFDKSARPKSEMHSNVGSKENLSETHKKSKSNDNLNQLLNKKMSDDQMMENLEKINEVSQDLSEKKQGFFFIYLFIMYTVYILIRGKY